MSQVIDVLDLFIERCGLAYGVSPCTADLGVTGEAPCFNTLRTCQSRATFDSNGSGGTLGTIATWSFTRPTDGRVESGIDAIPCIEDISYKPATIEPGEGLGSRAMLTITMSDFRFADTGPNGDPYLADRDYAPYKQGTFWGRWRARQFYMRGRSVRWRQGLLGQSLDEFETRHFVIESFESPGLDGRFKIICRDALQALFDDRAQCPPPTPGRLSVGISASATSATLVPAGVGNAYYSTIGSWVKIGSEIIGFSRTGNTLTLSRGLWGTTPTAHETGAQVQQCADDFISVRPDEAMAILATKYAGVSPSIVPTDDWENEIDTNYGGGLLTTLIAKPTPTRTLVKELLREVGLATWQDDLTGLLQLRVIREITTNATRFDARNAPGESNVIAGSFAVEEQPKRRISQAICYYGLVNPLEALDQSNLPVFAAQVAADDEAAEGSPMIDEIFSRWITSGGAAAAQAVTDRRLARYVRAPRRFTLNIPRWGSIRPVLGQGCLVLADSLQDDTGAPEAVPCQIIRIDPGAKRGAEFGLTLEELVMDPRFAPDPLLNAVTISAGENDLNFREKYDTLYVPPEAGDHVYLIINEAVVVGATSRSIAGIEIGSWPTQAKTATRTNGSPVLTGIASTAGIAPQMGVVGTGIPRGAKILSVNSGTQITLDRNATASGTSSITIGLVIIHVVIRGISGGKGGKGANGRGGDNTRGNDGEDGGIAIHTDVPINLEGDGEVLAPGGGGGSGGGDVDGFWGPQRNGGGGGGGSGAVPGAGGSGASPARAGSPGTLRAGGAGGNGSLNSNTSSEHRGGRGGDPGEDGGNANGYLPGTGGDEGDAIVGWSLVNSDNWAGTITGNTIG